MRCFSELPTPQTERTIFGVGVAVVKMAIYQIRRGKRLVIHLAVDDAI